jgi:hypothetical protein
MISYLKISIEWARGFALVFLITAPFVGCDDGGNRDDEDSGAGSDSDSDSDSDDDDDDDDNNDDDNDDDDDDDTGGDSDSDTDSDADSDSDTDADSDTDTGEDECAVPDQAGFNHYTVASVNDELRFPKDGTYPYCWEYTGATCGDMWGQIYDGYYGGELLFDGGGDCFCSGHTLEIFLDAWRRYREDNELGDDALFEVDGDTLTLDSVDIGEFYQWWQGFGVATDASSADAFETAGIGESLGEEDWDSALPGDYVNLSRSTGSGHAVIFVDWIEEGGEKTGLRYYGCNNSGDSCPDPDSEENFSGVSGPSFITEYFFGAGGTVLPEYLYIGRVFEPTL